MREKELKVVITFRTTADAMEMEKLCRKLSLPGRLIPVPRSITSDCGIAWCAPVKDRTLFETQDAMPEFGGIYEVMM